ncbi:unnamed protein product [Blepharisma stoltei]|uniref:Uncharacterized protein n=1 Tax=Blepharisma stoltei TaxID=1481888 RepID=A0AAU9J8S7_9CILI|nr:unnamed protein product [Blepharisma stoltei]
MNFFDPILIKIINILSKSYTSVSAILKNCNLLQQHWKYKAFFKFSFQSHKAIISQTFGPPLIMDGQFHTNRKKLPNFFSAIIKRFKSKRKQRPNSLKLSKKEQELYTLSKYTMLPETEDPTNESPNKNIKDLLYLGLIQEMTFYSSSFSVKEDAFESYREAFLNFPSNGKLILPHTRSANRPEKS